MTRNKYSTEDSITIATDTKNTNFTQYYDYNFVNVVHFKYISLQSKDLN